MGPDEADVAAPLDFFSMLPLALTCGLHNIDPSASGNCAGGAIPFTRASTFVPPFSTARFAESVSTPFSLRFFISRSHTRNGLGRFLGEHELRCGVLRLLVFKFLMGEFCMFLRIALDPDVCLAMGVSDGMPFVTGSFFSDGLKQVTSNEVSGVMRLVGRSGCGFSVIDTSGRMLGEKIFFAGAVSFVVNVISLCSPSFFFSSLAFEALLMETVGGSSTSINGRLIALLATESTLLAAKFCVTIFCKLSTGELLAALVSDDCVRDISKDDGIFVLAKMKEGCTGRGFKGGSDIFGAGIDFNVINGGGIEEAGATDVATFTLVVEAVGFVTAFLGMADAVFPEAWLWGNSLTGTESDAVLEQTVLRLVEVTTRVFVEVTFSSLPTVDSVLPDIAQLDTLVGFLSQ